MLRKISFNSDTLSLGLFEKYIMSLAAKTVSLIPASLLKSSPTAKPLITRRIIAPLTLVSSDLQAGLIGLQKGNDSEALVSLKKASSGLTHAVREIAYPANTPDREAKIQYFLDTHAIDIDNINGLINGINTKKAIILAFVFKPSDFEESNPNPYIPRIINAALSKLSVTSSEDREFILTKAKEFSADTSRISINEIMREVGLHFCLAYKGLYDKDCPGVYLPKPYDNKNYKDWVLELQEIGCSIQEAAPAVDNVRSKSLFSSADGETSETLFINTDRLFPLDLDGAKRELDAILNFEKLDFDPEKLLSLILELKDNMALVEIGNVSGVVDAAIGSYEKLGGVPSELNLKHDKSILSGLRNGILTKKAIIIACVFGHAALTELDDTTGVGADFDTVCERLGVADDNEKEHLKNRAISIGPRLDADPNVWRFFQVFREAFNVLGPKDTPNLILFEGKDINDWVADLRSELGERVCLPAEIRRIDYFREEVLKSQRRIAVTIPKQKVRPAKSGGGEVVKVLKINRDEFLAKSSEFLSDKSNTDLINECRGVSYPGDKETLVELYNEDTITRAEPVLVFLNVCKEYSESGKNILKISDLVKGLNRHISGNPLSREEAIGVLNQVSSVLIDNSIRTDIDFGEINDVDRAILSSSDAVLATHPASYQEFIEGLLATDEIVKYKLEKNELRRRLAKAFIDENTYPYFSLAKAYERVFLFPGAEENELTLHRLGNEIYPIPGIGYVIEVELKGTEFENLIRSRGNDYINQVRRTFINFLSENPHLHKLQITEVANLNEGYRLEPMEAGKSQPMKRTLPPLPTVDEAREFWALLQLD